VRFNIRTTDENAQEVQRKVLEAFRDTLAKVETTVGEPEPIPAAPAAEPAKEADKDATTKPAVADRFAGGSQFKLTFSQPIEPSTVQDQFVRVLAGRDVSTPERRFEIVAPAAPPRAARRAVEAVTIRTDLDPQAAQSALKDLATALELDPALAFDRVETFGGAVAKETRTTAAIAIVGSWLVIIAYLWFRFQSVAFGLAAVVALVHDVLIALGAVAISPYKIDLPMVAAFLTLIGFSVNDTIVIFDRIREIRGKTPYLTPQVINAAINQTLSRTILTALTAWLVVLILYLFGGEGLRGFSFCLVVGFLSGTYSTVYIAAPILIEWLNKKDDTKAPAKALAAGAAR
jgi:SecD/SecF fusion protein